MIIYLNEIYSSLEWWRAERKITAESQKEGYIINIMEEFGELADALRDYEKFSKHDCPYCEIDKQIAEYEIINALCNIGILTINAGADILLRKKETEIDTSEIRHILFNVNSLISDCANYDRSGCTNHLYYNYVLKDCASLCENWGFNFEVAILEKIRTISSSSGAYNEKADYEKARIEK